MTLKLKKTVALVGMMGAGKTAVGRALAEILGVAFLDSDLEIEKAANSTIPEIFSRDGEDFFRDREAEVLARLMGEGPVILSTGGGAFLQDRNRAVIEEKGIAVWLKADLGLLWSRVKHKDTRPLLHTENPYQTLADLCTAREPTYGLAGVIVEAHPDYSIEDMAHKVCDALAARPDVLEKD